ncbi:Oxysterol-binding protein-domain-containing protein [Blastocladiella britannica]|nr:Oxysterol-binding protein-domain-containing protein [Blastocladiella britannica]
MREGESREEEHPAELAGWLLKKKRKRMQGWAKRYFTYDRGQLAYAKIPGGFCRGSVPIALSTISVDPERRIINIDSGTSLWHLRALSLQDYEMWIGAVLGYKSALRAAGGAVRSASLLAAAAAAASGGAEEETEEGGARGGELSVNTRAMTSAGSSLVSSPISTVVRPPSSSTSATSPRPPLPPTPLPRGSPSTDALVRQFIANVDTHVDHLARLVLTANPPLAAEVTHTVRALATVLAGEKDELLDQLAAEAAKAAAVTAAYSEILRENAELRAHLAAGGAAAASAGDLVGPTATGRTASVPATGGTAAAAAVGAHRSMSLGSFQRLPGQSAVSNGSFGGIAHQQLHSQHLHGGGAGTSGAGPSALGQLASAAGSHARAGSIASTISGDQWFDAEELVLAAQNGDDSDDDDDEDDSGDSGEDASVSAATISAAAHAAGGKAKLVAQSSAEMVIYEQQTAAAAATGATKSSSSLGNRLCQAENGDDEDDEEDEDDDEDDDDDDESGYMINVHGGAEGNGKPHARNKSGSSSLLKTSTSSVAEAGAATTADATAAHVSRRKYLPSPVVGDDVSLLGILRKNVGKDLSTVAMPISLNEPINLLQKLAEELEYSHLLDRAAATGTDPLHRLLLVAAFAVSGYASSANRVARKPFNPLHGETYELVRQDRGFRYIAEKVSHQPPIMACHATSLPEGKWVFRQDSKLKSKFWGKSMELIPSGTVHVELPELGDHFTWTKVTTCMRNVIGGPKSLDHYGKMIVTNHATDDRVEITFKENGGGGWLGGGPSTANEVVGVAILGRGSDKAAMIRGRWSEMCVVSKSGDQRDEGQVIWRANDPIPNVNEMYGFTQFAIELNEITPDIADYLPPTDTRLRPDQAEFERGNVAFAEGEKLRLEEKQRVYRRELEAEGRPWVPQWFECVRSDTTGEEKWVYRGKYWETREQRAWMRAIDLW